jgi:hypothetical protein
MIWFFVIGIDSLVGNQMLSLWSMPVLFVPFCQCKRIVNISRKALPVGIKTDKDSIIWQKLHDNEYSCAAEPPIRCGVSHVSGQA